MNKFILNILSALLLLSCDDFLTLPRDNPNDVYNDEVYQDGISLGIESFEIVEDNNLDAVANSNETVYCRVEVVNYGEEKANKVRGSISTDSEFITILSPSEDIPFHSGDQSDDGIGRHTKFGYLGRTPYYDASYSFSFEVSKLNESMEVEFDLVLSDDDGHEWKKILTLSARSTDANIEFSQFVIQADNNEDGYININEQVHLLVYLKNSGTSPGENVKAKISTSSAFITDLYPEFELLYNSVTDRFTHMNPGDERYSQAGVLSGSKRYNLIFQVAPETPANSEIPFQMDITDEQGNAWQDEFVVNVLKTAAELRFSKVLIVGDDNDDGKVSPGEKAYLRIYIENIGASRANEVLVDITNSNTGVQNLIPDTPLEYRYSSNYNYIPSGGEVYGYYSSVSSAYYSLEFDVSQDMVVGTNITFNMEMVDGEGNIWEDSFDVLVE